MVMNDHGSSGRISSLDLLLIPTLLPRDLKRVINLRIGLLGLTHSSTFAGFFGNLSKEGKSWWRDLFWGSLEIGKGNLLPKDEMEAWLGSAHAKLNPLINISHMGPFYYKHIYKYVSSLIKTLHRHSYNIIVHHFTVYEHICQHMNFKM